MELKLYFKMLVTCYLIRLRCKSFTICEGTGSILFYSLPSLPEVLGRLCRVVARTLSVLCFQAYGAVSLGPCDCVLTSHRALWTSDV